MCLENDSRVAVVGRRIYFENHFPEGWKQDPYVNCFDVNEQDLSCLLSVANFCPQLSIFFRPELYPFELVKRIPGSKIAFLSEPVPSLENGKFLRTPETETRMSVYKNMPWHAYDGVIYYDKSRRATISKLGWPVDEFRMLPIDTASFRPRKGRRPIDVCFVGKPNERRVRLLDVFRYMSFRFVWVAHGIAGLELARLFQKSKVVLNIHADHLPALEPRVYLAASCGCAVMTEALGAEPHDIRDQLVPFEGPIHKHIVEYAIELYRANCDQWLNRGPLTDLSMRRFIAEQLQNFSL